MQKIITAIALTILTARLGPESVRDQSALRHTAATMRQKIMRMPRQMAVPLALLTRTFNLCGIVRTAKPFTRQSPAQRAKQWTRWRAARCGVCRDFTLFFEKLILFIHLSRNGFEKQENKTNNAPEPVSRT